MPFGLKNAPSTFQKCMYTVLGNSLRKFTMVYIDDIIIFSKTVEDHLKHLRWVLEKFKQSRLKFGPEKCLLI